MAGSRCDVFVVSFPRRGASFEGDENEAPWPSSPTAPPTAPRAAR